MSLSKMAPLAWHYYAEEVAAGREDYFAAGAERPGRFLGRGVEALGIADTEVTSEAMERLFGHGCDPRDGAALGRGLSPEDDRAVAGFALTFSPPKTASVLWALGDAELSSAVLSAHEAAVEEALGFLEDHAALTRRGHGGILQVDTDGLVAASFVHRTSRASDPQLHTHVLVASKVRAKDGHRLSLDARELFSHQKAAGMLYKAAPRAELTARCGVSWTSVDDNGIAEVEGVPVELCDAWSARRQAVKTTGDALVAEREAALGRSLTSSERAQCFQLAAYRTRTAKVDAETPTEVVKQRWHEEAVGFGQDPERFLADVLGHERGVVVTPGVEVLAVEVLADEVLRDPEMVSLEAPLPVEAPEFLRREDGMAQLERHGGRRFATTGALRREAAVLEAAAAGAEPGIGIALEAVVSSAISDARLGGDQEAAVRGLLLRQWRQTSSRRPPGSPRTRSRSCSASCSADSSCSRRARSSSTTRPAWREATTSHASSPPCNRTGQSSSSSATRTSSVRSDRAGCCGPSWRTTVRTSSRRCAGSPTPGGPRRHCGSARDPSILPVYVAHDRILEGSRPAMLDAALLAWRAGRATGRDVLVMAGDNATADELSRRCRAERVMAGEVERDGVAVASGLAGVGDEVVTLRNDRSLRAGEGDFVRNGARWRVVARDETGALQVEPLAGGTWPDRWSRIMPVRWPKCRLMGG